jgi:tripeptidyl-peptidase II
MTRPRLPWRYAGLLGLAAGCAGPRVASRPPTSPVPADAVGVPVPPRSRVPTPADATSAKIPEPIVAPAVAYAAGLMPLAGTAVREFLRAHSGYDGRGVLIAILDSGIDARAAGLIVTSTGLPKVVELRDFSGEGRVGLVPVEPDDDGTVAVAGRGLRGARRIGRLAVRRQWYAGTLRELPLGDAPAADLNGNGTNTDVYALVVVRATDGWAVFLDTNLDGSFEDEMPLHDYRQGRETLTFGVSPITLAANFQEASGQPVLDLYFDTSAHGTHVAGIAAGYNLYDVAGFHGVAPGAQLLGLKIANNARGGVSVHGSMVRAMDYAARFAEQRGMPLVLNLSFGVGNEHEGRAVIDSLVNAFIAAHPAVVFVISAGNDGPGLSTMGFPGSADLALSAGATYPGVFAQAPEPDVPPPPDVMGFWSARGGELAKPEVVAPGIAYSSVPRWNTSHEVKLGTSMAAPHVAGLAACLLSAMAQEQRRVSGTDIAQALEVSARRLPGGTVLDQGGGLPQLPAAYGWLVAGHQGSGYVVRTDQGASAAFRRRGPAGPGDTVDVFRVLHRTGLRAAQYLLRSDVPWLTAPEVVTAEPGATVISVVRRPSALFGPGAHIGSVMALNPTDTLAGPLFRLVSTVVVSHDLDAKPLDDQGRQIPPGRVQRYFLRADRPGSTLEVTVTLPDSARESATVNLYEPDGQPFRGGGELALGDEDGGTARIVVRSEDFIPGVYELDISAPPLERVTATAHAHIGPFALGPASGGGALEVTSLRPGTVQTTSQNALVGAERAFPVHARGAPPETLLARVPEWASEAEVDVQLPPEQWDRFTDFAVTVFDSVGRRLAGEAMDYAFGRLRVPLAAALVGQPLVVELFPAYALVGRTPPWRATVTLRFLLRAEQPLGRGSQLTVVPGGRVRVSLPELANFALPEGFRPVVESSLGGSVRRVALGAER